MKPVRMLTGMFVLAALVLSAPLSAENDSNEKSRAEVLRALHAEFSPRVVVLSWRSETAAMGQNISSSSATTGVLIGDDGLVVVSNQVFDSPAAGIGGMFGGGGGTPRITDMKVNGIADEGLDALKAHEDSDLNLRWFGAHGADKGKGVDFPADVSVPEIGEEVVVIGAHDATLNFARFFKVARINAVVEEGKYYGLDGAIQDCLGALVVTMDGRVLGIIGEKRGEQQQGGGGGIGRIMGGLSDPSRALGNRVLMTPAVFGESLKQAHGKVTAEGFFEGKAPTETAPPPPSETEAVFEGTVASATWREETEDVWVLIDVGSGDVPTIDSKVEVLNAAGNTFAEVTITRHYRDPLDPSAPIDQVGGTVADPENTLGIQRGWRVVVWPQAESTPPAAIEFRGIERFMRVGPDIMESRFGGVAKAGYQVSQRPARDSQTREAGIRAGDVIIKVNDTEVTEEMTLEDFLQLLRSKTGEVKLKVVRSGGETTTITVPE
jgi:hypothetical protein